MEWYWILLIVLGGACLLVGLYLILAAIIAKGTLKAATTPNAHTFEDSREALEEFEGLDVSDYYNVWKRENFELNGVQGKLRGEIIYNDKASNDNRAKVAVICHGHTWNRLLSVRYAQIFYAKGYNVVIYDHAYFGESEGSHTTVGDKERYDLNTVLDYVREVFGKQAIVALHGESMGAATVLLELGVRNDIDMVVADCPFSNTMRYYRELCKNLTHLPGFPIVDFANVSAKRKLGYDFTKVNPIDAVRSSNVPICFIHGNADTYINMHHSVDMHKVSTNPLSELHLIDGADHARSFHVDNVRYTQIVSDFLDKVEANLANA